MNPEESFKTDEEDFFFKSPEFALKFLLFSSISVVFFELTSAFACLKVVLPIFFFFFSFYGDSEIFSDSSSASSLSESLLFPFLLLQILLNYKILSTKYFNKGCYSFVGIISSSLWICTKSFFISKFATIYLWRLPQHCQRED